MRGLNNKLAGQIGEYVVCAELCRRGFISTPFSGNVPTFDVLATDSKCRTVPIQVKSSRGENWQTDARLWMQLELKQDIQAYSGPKEIQNPDEHKGNKESSGVRRFCKTDSARNFTSEFRFDCVICQGVQYKPPLLF